MFNKFNKILSEQEKNKLINNYSKQYNIEYALLRAIIELESSSTGFYDVNSIYSMKCKVRFEPDYFYKFSKERPYFLPSNISIEEAKKNKLYTGRNSYEKALIQSPQSAMQATSFGLGQIMGFNYKRVGYTSIETFAREMEESEYYHITAMIKFITNNKSSLIAAQQRDFLLIAKTYNGNNYINNNYEKKLKEYYNKFSREYINI